MLWLSVLLTLVGIAIVTLALSAYREARAARRQATELQRDLAELTHTAKALFDLVSIQNKTFQALRVIVRSSADRATVEDVLAKFPVPPGAPTM